MLTKTSEAGIQALIYVVLAGSEDPLPPRVIAEDLGQSPSYLSKISAQLVKANILVAHRGVHGGVTLSRPPDAISLLDIVQALQGLIVGRYCDAKLPPRANVCAFHAAMEEVHEATIEILSKWTLADLVAQPLPSGPAVSPESCVMARLQGIAARREKRG